MKCPLLFKYGNVLDNKFNKKQLRMGIKAEMGEHTKNRCLAKQIAKGHLMGENPNYYTYLNQMEKKFKK